MKHWRHILYCIVLSAFLLGSHNGYIALWKGSDPEPVKVFPYKVSSLPKADQALLKKGIAIDSLQELTRLIEDYLS